jgi:hypothetical protein
VVQDLMIECAEIGVLRQVENLLRGCPGNAIGLQAVWSGFSAEQTAAKNGHQGLGAVAIGVLP